MNEFRYGDNNTIHRTGYVDVEVNEYGAVVAVWFRCHTVPFRETIVDIDRAKEMEKTYKEHKLPNIKAIVFEEH
jgi:hypothetical protein